MRGKTWFLLVNMTLLAALMLSACEFTLPETVTVPEEPAPDVVAETVQAKLTQIAISTLVMQLTEVKSAETTESPLVATEEPKAVDPTATTEPTLAPTATLQPTATSTPKPPPTVAVVPVIPITPVASLTPTRTPTTGYYVPSKTPTKTSPTPIVCYRARYIADVTIPDNTVLSPGQAFVKTWRIKNDGTCVWTTAFDFINTSGGSLGGPAVIDMPAAVNPGDMIDVSLSMVAPADEGTYTSYWQVRTDGGTRFGWGADADGAFWVRIKVED